MNGNLVLFVIFLSPSMLFTIFVYVPIYVASIFWFNAIIEDSDFEIAQMNLIFCLTYIPSVIMSFYMV